MCLRAPPCPAVFRIPVACAACMCSRCARLCVFVAWRVVLGVALSWKVLQAFSSFFFVSLALELLKVYVVRRFYRSCCRFLAYFLVVESGFVFSSVSCLLNMPPPRSTNNSLAAGVVASQSSDASVVVASMASGSPSSSLSADSIAEAVARAIGSSLPAILSSIPVKAHSLPVSNSSVSSVALNAVVPSQSYPSSVVSSSVASSQVSGAGIASSPGTFTLPPFISTFTPVSAITGSSSTRLVAPVSSTFSSATLPCSLPSLGPSTSQHKSERSFAVGPGHAPVPGKLVKKIIDGQFVELADLLSVNIRAADQEPQAYLDGKILVASKRRQLEIKDVLTWIEAFSIFQLVLCSAHPHRWTDTTKYKLLVVQTARQFPGLSWLEYDLAYRKDAAASGLTDWSRMNLDLYHFHLRSPASAIPPAWSAPSPRSSQSPASQESGPPLPFCLSWNEGQCRWPFGRCRFRHCCSNCEGEHFKITCPFPRATGQRSRSPSARDSRGRH